MTRDPLKCLQQSVIARICGLIDGLAANGPIDMDNGGHVSTRLIGCFQGYDHEGSGHRALQISGRGFYCEAWAKRSPVLAKFDCRVDPVARLGFARIGKNGSTAESAWPSFHASLKPGDHVTSREQLGSRIGDVGGSAVICAAFLKLAFDITVRETGAKVEMFDWWRASPGFFGPKADCCPDGKARVHSVSETGPPHRPDLGAATGC